MTAAPPAAPASEPDDLAWLLALFDDWLMIAEPSTIRELDAFLRSVDSTATSVDVITQLRELREQ